MANKKTAEEKIQELEKRMEQLKAQKKALQVKQNKIKRAQRTRRLIQLGALSEKYFSCTDIEPDKYESLLKKLVNIEQVKVVVLENENNR